MSLRNGPWRLVAGLTHLDARAQRRLWRVLVAVWCVALTVGWAVLAAFTRGQEKACAEAGQEYVVTAPLAAEVMDLRARKGQFQSQPPLLAAEQVAAAAGIDKARLRITPAAASAGGPAADPASDPGQSISLHAQALTLRELVDVLRDLKVEAGLGTLSAHLAPTPGRENRMDLDMVLSR